MSRSAALGNARTGGVTADQRFGSAINLTVHFKRQAYLVTPTAETLPLGGKTRVKSPSVCK